MSLSDYLQQAGYRCYGPDPVYPNANLWERQVECDIVCARNDKLCVHVGVWSDNPHGCQIEICAQMPSGTWARLKLYSLTERDIMANLPQYERQLIAAWRAVQKEQS